MTTMNKFKLSVFLLILISAIIFLLQNTLSLEVDFLFFNLIKISLIKLLLVFTSIGFLAGLYVYYSFTHWKKSKLKHKEPLELEIERS
jgi:uncharacterized integral membrane protein